MASSFKGVVEKFKVTMVNNETGSTERVTIQLSLDGLKVLNQDASRTLRSYNLRNVSRWDLMDTSTVIWTKTDVDLEERPLTLSSDPTTIRNLVDTLATCCLQLAEFIKDKESDHQTANNLEELAAGGGKTRKAAKLPSVDSVEYWRNPDKAGWLQSQSEVMKMWRKRWFVLKQGYLFRFLSPDVSESVKPRGVVDLSKVQDVRDGRSVTGKANTLQLKTAAGGSVCYICESETEMVEWISALEGSIAKIVKLLAGIDETPRESSKDKHTHRSSSSRDKGGSSSSTASEWAKQMERSTSQSSRKAGGSSSSRMNGSTMVSVVDYSGGRAGGSSGAYGGSSGAYGSSSNVYGGSSSNAYGGSSSGYVGSGGRASAPSYDDYGGISNYNQISGVAGVASAMDDLSLNYGGYQPSSSAAGPPTAAAAGGGGSHSSYATYEAPPGGGYGSSSSAGPAGFGSSSNAYGSSGYQQDAGSSGYGYAGSSSYQVPAAAATAAGYGYQQQQQQQPPAGYAAGYGASAADGGYYQQQQQQLQQQPAVLLIDQVPSQQPAYPYYQQLNQAPAAAPEPAAAAAAPAATGWQVHHTTEGRPYYYNPSTGTTQWEAPPGM